MGDTSEGEGRAGAGLWVGLGLGAGALLGLTLAWRASQSRHAQIVETVEELRERTHRVLNDLSDSVSGLMEQTRLQGDPAATPPEETSETTTTHSAQT